MIVEAAPLKRVIDPDMTYGAVERVVASMTDALNDQENVVLFALPGSQTHAGSKIESVDRHLMTRILWL